MKETRDQIVLLADQLIRTQGFNAFSYADIAGPMAIRRPAVHHYFPVKSDLGISVIDNELERIAHQKQEIRDLPGDQQLKSIVEAFYFHHRKGYICLTGSLTPDYMTLPPAMQHSVQQMCETTLDLAADALEKGRKEGNLQFSGTASDRALLVLSTLLSSLLLSRVLKDNIFDRMIDQLFIDLGSSIRVSQFPEYTLSPSKP